MLRNSDVNVCFQYYCAVMNAVNVFFLYIILQRWTETFFAALWCSPFKISLESILKKNGELFALCDASNGNARPHTAGRCTRDHGLRVTATLALIQ